ncbi:MAG: hypothetical protein FJ012_08625 [Chloroflexi bacterium]|nr:hypothetical protein [Chloroflexota bacterium]
MLKRMLLVAAVVLVAFVSACAEPVPLGGGAKSLIDQVKRLPKESTGFTFWDIAQLGAKAEVYGIWQEWERQESDWLKDTAGIRTGEVKLFVQASIPDLGIVTIVSGDFDGGDVEKQLIENGYTLGKYLGVRKLTKAQDGGQLAVALYRKSIIVGSEELVGRCIDVVKKKDSHSLYQDPYIRKIVDRLPGGVMTGVERNEDLYDRLIALGMSVQIRNKETLKVKAVYEFEVANAAKHERTLVKVRDDLTKPGVPIIKGECFDPEAKPKNEFIEGTALMRITSFSYFNLSE